jgi:hypothetical protein
VSINKWLRGILFREVIAANNRLVLPAAVFVTGFRSPALLVCEGLMADADGMLYKTSKHGDYSSSSSLR